MSTFLRPTLLVVALYTATLPAFAQSPGWPACEAGEIEVVLFGTFHMAGSSDDIQRDVDNMLSERRQREMPAVVEWLVSMAPDRIGVEIPVSDGVVLDEAYDAFIEGNLELTANEVHQLGFRTAAALGHSDIFTVDYRMGIGNDSISAFYDRNPEARRRNGPIGIAAAAAGARADSLLAALPLADYLRYVNQESTLRSEGNRQMYAHLIAGENDNYGGADLMSRWYARNARMVHHITRIALPTDERVLVIVGSGHVRPMRDILDLSPHFCPVSPLQFGPAQP